MKNLFRLMALACSLLIVFSACRGAADNQTETSIETAETMPEPSNEYPPWQDELEQELSPEVKKNMDTILGVLRALEFSGRFYAYNLAHSIAVIFNNVGIPEIREVEIIEINEFLGGRAYRIRFVDVNDDAYRIGIDSKFGSFGHLYKEGEEVPIYMQPIV